MNIGMINLIWKDDDSFDQYTFAQLKIYKQNIIRVYELNVYAAL